MISLNSQLKCSDNQSAIDILEESLSMYRANFDEK